MAAGCSKTFLSLLNSLLIIFGIALIVLSFYIYNKYESIQVIIGVIVLAFFVTFISLLGLIGTLRQSKCALTIYIILVGLITLVLLTILILLCTRENWIITNAIKNYEQYVNNPKLLNDDKMVKVTRDFFAKLKCCGFKQRNEPEKIFDDIEACRDRNQTKLLCEDKMKDDLNRNLVAVIVIHAILTGLGALACIMALHVACSANNMARYPNFQSRYR
ncbi:unnamed protein product [Adineta ricciae]|uniref:Tetraspanin n=1 Tax=Adineta ricciae TaxID=249248 RepID=A0A813R9Q8_ADIRI|nr:unnamed protein product [Adineta ricciae]CAF1683364.1 unnamed protein product [Adineta ricciae]